MVTIQILTKNNERTVAKTLESLVETGHVVVGDLGSNDSTVQICRSFGAEVIDLNWNEDYSEARNKLIREGVNFYIEPWEVLVSGSKLVSSASLDKRVIVIENKIVTKEMRIWSGGKFENPVFETVVGKADLDSKIVIISNGRPDRSKENIKLAERWVKKNPTSSEAYYYLACANLSCRNYENFLKISRHYLAMNENSEPAGTMIRYYMGLVELHMGLASSSSSNILHCLALHPTFAEFWCLLGDAYYSKSKYEKAEWMYRNAISMGKKRLNDDEYPIEIKKYEEYPNKMINNIIEAKNKSKLIVADANNI